MALDNQCTGNPAYESELDNDPANATECATVSDRGTIVHAAALLVFAQPSATSGARCGAGPGDPPGQGRRQACRDRPVRKRTTTTKLRTQLAPGTHRVRVVFRPDDPTAYSSARSGVVRITVRG